MTFRVGMEVVCVDADDKEECFGYHSDGPWPVKNGVYTVEVMETRSGVLWLGLAEFSDEIYTAYSFRPVVTRKTDISVFEELLKTKSEKELV
jgi:hypothetical protein